MSQTEYLLSRVLQNEGLKESLDQNAAFYRACGLDAGLAAQICQDRLQRRELQSTLPPAFKRLRANDLIRIGKREWHVVTGAGHAVEQIMLFSPSDRIFLSADQVLPEISPNISVGSILPDANPLGDFLRSLRQLKTEVPDEALVLPGHRTPFFGLHTRIDELQRHHESRCAAVLAGCRNRALSGLDLIPVVFERTFGCDVIGSAIGEAVAHANYLLAQGELATERRADGTILYRSI